MSAIRHPDMPVLRWVWLLALVLLLGASAVSCDDDDDDDEPDLMIDGTKTQLTYAGDILPILDRHGCTRCHGTSGNMNLSILPDTVPSGASGEALFTPCDADNSLIIRKTSCGDECGDVPGGQPMPPAGADAPVSAPEIQLLRTWINEGGQAEFTPGACP